MTQVLETATLQSGAIQGDYPRAPRSTVGSLNLSGADQALHWSSPRGELSFIATDHVRVSIYCQPDFGRRRELFAQLADVDVNHMVKQLVYAAAIDAS